MTADRTRSSPGNGTAATDSETDRIFTAVDELHDGLVAAVREAVRIPSITPRYPGQIYDEIVGGESAVAELVANHYRRAGCDIDLFGLEPGRDNCVGVRRGSGGGRSLIFNGHTDVVPADPATEWTGGDPWSGEVRDDRIWGRGSCDMKGGVIAQAFAAIALQNAGIGLLGDLILEAVVGEEMMEHQLGTTACIERGYRADAAVVSEPTSPPVPLAVAPVTAGVLWFEAAVTGKPSHTAMRGETVHPGGYGSDVGVNAIDKAILVHRVLRELEDEWALSKRHPLYRPGHFAINPGVFIGGPRTGLVPFSIPDSATIDYIVWYSPDEDATTVERQVEERISSAASQDDWLRDHPPVITWKHHWPKTAIDPNEPIVAAACTAHERALGETATLAGFVAVNDATYLNQAGIPTITYGPGDLRVAHGVDEFVPIPDLVAAAKTYALLAANWCGVDRPRKPTTRRVTNRPRRQSSTSS